MIKADNHCITFQEGQISIFEDCPIDSTDWRATCMQTFDYSRSWLHRILFLSWLRKKQGDKDGVKGSPIDVKDPFLKYQV